MSFAYGFGLPHWHALSGGAFSPAQLFQGGVQGAWYDPSDSGPTGTGGVGTLFSDRAGTTPCGTPGGGSVVPVGLMLDKSQGLVLGPELVTNGDFSNGTTGWTAAANNTLTNDAGRGKCVSSVAKGAGYCQTFSAVANTTYKFVWSGISDGTSVAPAALLGTVLGASNRMTAAQTGGYAFGTNRIFYYTATATETLWLWFYGNIGQPIGNYILIDNVSVQSIAGNHAIAANDTTARPELRARVNLLTYSEQFDNAAWTKTGGTITANADTAPDGTLTADLLTGNGTTFVAVQQSAGTLGTGRASFYVKAGTETKCEIWPNLGSSLARFDLSAVTATNTGGSNAAITAVGNGWFRISVDSSTFNANVRLILGYGAPTLSTTMLLWGAQLTATNEFPANTYQRIVDANTYDAVGFPRYLVANGTSSAMSTPGNVNLSGTDKVTVFAGVRKLSDGFYPTIAEMSTDASANNGTWAIYAAGNSTPRYPAYLRGTIRAGFEPQTYAAPISNVFTVAADISQSGASAELVPRINGVVNQTNPNGADAGTGNFGSYPLFIGARNNGTGFFLNGNIYSLIVVGSAVSAGQISATEQWVAGKVGITI